MKFVEAARPEWPGKILLRGARVVLSDHDGGSTQRGGGNAGDYETRADSAGRCGRSSGAEYGG